MCASSERLIKITIIRGFGQALTRLLLLVLGDRNVLLGVVVVSAYLLEVHLPQDSEEGGKGEGGMGGR